MAPKARDYQIDLGIMHPDQLERHISSGLHMRHDLIPIGGIRIPAWTGIALVGAPDGAVVDSPSSVYQVVVTETKHHLGLFAGQVYDIGGRELIAAQYNETTRCVCTRDTNPACQNVRNRIDAAR
jgi:hypothetical protein